MANEHGEPFVLDFPNGQRVEDILKKAAANYSKAEIDTKMSSKANTADVYSKTEIDTALDRKVDKVPGKGLSTNDYTTDEKNKLAGIEAQANKTIVDDALSDSSTNPIQNKVIKSALDSKADASDIPTVPITATQKNGTSITPVSGTVNITVPTTATDVSALPDTTKYATALSLTINSSTFVMTGQLKDQNGDNLGTAQTIDLPLESVVVGGSYDSQTKKVVLTLQNGNTVEFSVADLVSGLQTELSASNKLNPAYINYDSTHRAVSDTEKSAWNSKQNALSSTQLDAVNSGITSEGVTQIETNETALVELVDGGAKNIAAPLDVASREDLTITNDNGRYTITGTITRPFTGYLFRPAEPLQLTTDCIIIGAEQLTGLVYSVAYRETAGSNMKFDSIDTQNKILPSGAIISYIYVQQNNAGTEIFAKLNLMLCTVADYAISPDFVPYRPSYQELYEMVKALQANQ